MYRNSLYLSFFYFRHRLCGDNPSLGKESEPYPEPTGNLSSTNMCPFYVKHPYCTNSSYLQLSYILDTMRTGEEIIVKEGAICLTREEFWSLGLRRNMDSNVSRGNFFEGEC